MEAAHFQEISPLAIEPVIETDLCKFSALQHPLGVQESKVDLHISSNELPLPLYRPCDIRKGIENLNQKGIHILVSICSRKDFLRLRVRPNILRRFCKEFLLEWVWCNIDLTESWESKDTIQNTVKAIRKIKNATRSIRKHDDKIEKVHVALHSSVSSYGYSPFIGCIIGSLTALGESNSNKNIRDILMNFTSHFDNSNTLNTMESLCNTLTEGFKNINPENSNKREKCNNKTKKIPKRTLVYGNTCSTLENTKGKQYGWEVFLERYDQEASKKRENNLPFVKSVTFETPCDDDSPPLVLFNPPFRMNGHSWGTLVIIIRVQFKRKNLSDIVLEHELDFSSPITLQYQEVIPSHKEFMNKKRAEWKRSATPKEEQSIPKIAPVASFLLGRCKRRLDESIIGDCSTELPLREVQKQFVSPDDRMDSVNLMYSPVPITQVGKSLLQHLKVKSLVQTKKQSNSTSSVEDYEDDQYNSLLDYESMNSPILTLENEYQSLDTTGGSTLIGELPIVAPYESNITITYKIDDNDISIEKECLLEEECSDDELTMEEETLIRNCLARYHFEDYACTFIEHCIKVDCFPFITQEDLGLMGIVESCQVELLVALKRIGSQVYVDTDQDEEGLNYTSTISYREIAYKELEIEPQCFANGYYGAIYRGIWRGQTVAIKKIKGILNQNSTEEFRREAAIMERLNNHPAIAFFVGICTHPSHLCIITKYYEKGSAYDFFVHGKLSVESKIKAKLLADAASGIMHLHKEGLVHCDIAARNILIANDYSGRISDFGLSRVFKRATPTSTPSRSGPVRWMAPELLRDSSKHSSYSDSWSFGVTIWEIYFQQKPYGSDLSTKDIIKKVLQGNTLSYHGNCPPAIASLLDDCFQIEPSKRPSFKDIWKRLNAYHNSLLFPIPKEFLSLDCSRLQTNDPTLTKLDPSEEAQSMSQALATNSCLTELKQEMNHIGSEGALSISQALEPILALQG